MSLMDTEQIMRDLKDDLEANLPASLAFIESQVTIDPIPLAVPASWSWSTEQILAIPFNKFPRMVLLGAPWLGEAKDATGRYVQGKHQLQIAAMVCLNQNNPANFDLAQYYAWRYSRAIQHCIANSTTRYGGMSLTSTTPSEVADMEVLPHSIEGVPNYWLAGVLLQYSLEGRYLC